MLSRLVAELDVLKAINHADLALARAAIDLETASGLVPAEVAAKVGFIAATRLAFAGDRFDVEIQGVEPVPAFVIEALDAREAHVDLVAWPIGRPAAMAALHGLVVLLGEADVDAHWASPLAAPLRVHRVAEGWLRAGCVGCVPICPRRAARAFVDMGCSVEADDDAHGIELHAARQELVAPRSWIMVREAA